MNKELRERLKLLVRGGAYEPLESLVTELKNNEQMPKYKGGQGKFVYECGRAEGRKEGMEILISELNQIGNVVQN